jgi:hypothetical protein
MTCPGRHQPLRGVCSQPDWASIGSGTLYVIQGAEAAKLLSDAVRAD